jgi:cardiolipin synthase
LSRSRAPIEIEGADGLLSRAARVRMTRQLSGAGDTDLLDYHLAAMRDIGAPPLLTGNRADLLIDGPSTYAAMFSAIENARTFVLVESFIFEEASAGERQLSVMLTQAAATRGRDLRAVRRRRFHDYRRPVPRTAQSGWSRLCAFNPLNPFDPRFSGINQRDHRKIVVVDGSSRSPVASTSARPIASPPAGTAPRPLQREHAPSGLARYTHRHSGHGRQQLEGLFRATWLDAECADDVKPPFQERTIAAGDTLLQVIASTPDDERNEIYATLLSVITYAQRRIDVTMAYFVPDDTLEHALEDAAGAGSRCA